MKTINMQSRAASVKTPKEEFISFGGGLDVTTPPINTNPGTLRESQNWTVDVSQGYRRVCGYERIDGRPAPSDAEYAILDVTITGSIEAGDTIQGVSSSATAVVLLVVTTTTPDYLVITKITGTFTADEDLNVAAVKEGEAIGLPVVGGADTAQLHAQYGHLAANEYRDDITAVTGSGPIRGVFVLNDIKYAFRDNAGATACIMWKTSASGWTQVTFYEEVRFTGGNDSVEDGDTLTQGAVTATIERVMVIDGTSPTLSGGLVISGRAGGNFASGAATSTGGGALTLSGAQTAISLSAGGRFDVVVQNFTGAAGTLRAYGCDGVNRGWEFDGTVFAPITTNTSPDTPEHVIEHKFHLFFSFGSSAVHSAIGLPFRWDANSVEIAVGDDITGFIQEGGSGAGTLGEGALAIISRNKTHILYGTSYSDWNLIAYRDELGGYEWSMQHIGSTVMVDDRGITSLVTSEKYGNFEHSTLSRLIRPWIAARRSAITASCISRENSQYRLFFNGGIALYTTFDGQKVLGMMPMLFAHDFECAWSSELNDGTEIILVGDSNGYVYQMDKGTSFDGESVEHYLVFHFNHLKTPSLNKEFYSGYIEVQGEFYSSFNFTYELGYGSADIPQPETSFNQIDLSTAKWDAFTWDAFYWDGKTLVPGAVELAGTAENISFIIRGDSTYECAIKLSGILLQYKPRAQLRYNNG